MLRLLLALTAAAALSACATAPQTRSGFLSSYDGLTPRTDTLRAKVRERRDPAGLQRVQRVRLEPARFAPQADVSWMSEAERALLLRQLDAQLCFAFSRRFDLAAAGPADARVRAAVSLVKPTGRAGSGVAAAARFFIPGPIGVRPPLGLGALGAEAEMVDAATDAQLAAITWSRQANPVGTDTPSLSRIGDALQYAGPFARAAARTFSPAGAQARKIAAGSDPCAQYGPRFRPEGFASRLVTGLYVPELSGAKAGEAATTAEQAPEAGEEPAASQ